MAAIGFSMRRIGAVGARPVPVDVVTGASGSWITTASAVTAGILMGFLHFGQGPVRPANWSLTENRELQLGQITAMAMETFRSREGAAVAAVSDAPQATSSRSVADTLP
jgi:hypothetical protein